MSDEKCVSCGYIREEFETVFDSKRFLLDKNNLLTFRVNFKLLFQPRIAVMTQYNKIVKGFLATSMHDLK